MVTAAVATAFRVQTKQGVTTAFRDRLDVLNQEVIDVANGKYLMALSVFELDSSTGEYRFYSAGGLPMYVQTQEASAKTKAVSAQGAPLGQQQFAVGERNGTLQDGDRIFLFTDGLPEVEQANGRQIGFRGFRNIVDATKHLPLEEAVQSIINDVRAKSVLEIQDDDWTLVAVSWQSGKLTTAQSSANE